MADGTREVASQDPYENTRLGTILLENPLMREEDIERCLEIQALTGGLRPLGEILVEEGVISEMALDELLAIQQSRRVAPRGSVTVEGTGPDGFLQTAVANQACDLIMSEGRPVLVRAGGSLRSLSEEPVTSAVLLEFLARYMGEDITGQLAAHRAVTREFSAPGVARGRISAFRHFDGICATIRLHPDQVRDARGAGLPIELTKAMGTGKGMILLTGEARSGMSETIATLQNLAAAERGRFVLVLDREFEAPPPRGGAFVVRRRVGCDTVSYASGLRAAIAENADVIFVGDATEPEAYDLSLRAAEAGHMVIATLRARSVVAALERILNSYPSYDVPRVRSALAAVINCVCALNLVPTKADGQLVLATEVLALNDAARDVVRSGPLTQLNLLMRLDSSECGHSLDDSLIDLLRHDRIAFEEAFRRAEDKTRILQAAQRR